MGKKAAKNLRLKIKDAERLLSANPLMGKTNPNCKEANCNSGAWSYMNTINSFTIMHPKKTFCELSIYETHA